jgi:FdrA protein
VSTPGQYAFADALDAVEAGLLTMVFSDNVPVEQEVALKERAAQVGTLVMGPDCGTAVVGGVGLGFANVVRPGPVGIVAASGTGAQHLLALLDGADVGVSHCLGVGGRDLSEAVGGRSTLAALDLLDADPGTELVVVVSKPPADAVAEKVRAHAATLSTPVVFGLLGPGRPDLTETARAVVETAGRPWAAPEHWPGSVVSARGGGSLRGLFAGGTLCDEAMIVAAEELGPIASNIPLDPADALGGDLASRGHTMVDFGDDDLTRGRPHPMIDGSLRVERLLQETADPTCGVLLLDVVLGLGADPDPAASLVEPVRRATEAGVPVVVAVVGTRDDPQNLLATCAALNAAGAHVHLSNAAAARAAVALTAGGTA